MSPLMGHPCDIGGMDHIATGANQTINVGANGGTLETQNTGQDLFSTAS